MSKNIVKILIAAMLVLSMVFTFAGCVDNGKENIGGENSGENGGQLPGGDENDEGEIPGGEEDNGNNNGDNEVDAGDLFS